MSQWNKFLRPDNLDVDPNSEGATKEWKYWYKKFENFLNNLTAPEGGPPIDRLMVLTAHLSSTVYEYVEDCTSYYTAIELLKKLYVKPPNPIYTRYLLVTRKQKANEKLSEFLLELHKLSKDCQLNDVTAEEYRKELVRDAFINELSSTYIRSRLFEHSQEEGKLELEKAVALAESLHTAQVDSSAYQQGNDTSFTAAMKKETEEFLKKSNFTEGEDLVDNKQMLAAAPTVLKACYYCGRENHEKSKCPARQSNCRKCGKLGHCGAMCRSKQKSFGQGSNNISAAIHKPFCAIPGGLVSASKSVQINGKRIKLYYYTLTF